MSASTERVRLALAERGLVCEIIDTMRRFLIRFVRILEADFAIASQCLLVWCPVSNIHI